MSIDPQWMLSALELAAQAEGMVAPNPMVGCVLVHQDVILAEGYHKGPGQWHAERMALMNLEGMAPKDAVLYAALNLAAKVLNSCLF